MLRILTLTLLLFSLLPSWSAATEKQVKHPATKTVEAKAVKAKSKAKLIKTKSVSNKSVKAKSVKTKNKHKQLAAKQTAANHTKARHSHLVKQEKSKQAPKATYAKNSHPKNTHLVKTQHLAATRVVDEEDDDDDDDVGVNDMATSNTVAFSKTKNFPPVIDAVETGAINTKTQQLVDYAKRFLGTSYRFGGYSPATGFDCSGYVSYVYGHVAGIELPHSASAISRIGARVPRANLRPGDLVFFGHRFRRAVGHVGIYMGNNRFIHASSSRTGYVEISDLRERYWTRTFEGGRRLMEG
jgi:cell wall-associated NlpC family hydrolase